MTGVPIYLVSACSTGEEFVAAFRRYADRGSLFVPIAEPIPAGRRGRFALTLAGGGVLIEGDAEVISSSKVPSVLHGRIGMTIRFGELDEPSKSVLIELEKARLATKPAAPSVPPRMVELPEGPRPKPPAASVRIDASVALAECTALGDLEALEKSVAAPPKAGPKFVMPSVLPVGAPRPKTPSGAVPTIDRPKTPSGPQPVVRPKTPSVAPPMPSLSPLPKTPSAPIKAPAKLPLDIALANASAEIEAAKTEAMDVPPAPLTPSSMDAVDGPRTEAMAVPPAPFTPSSMTAVQDVPRQPAITPTEVSTVPAPKPAAILDSIVPTREEPTTPRAVPPRPTPPAGQPAAKPGPEWMLTTVRSAAPPAPAPPAPAPPIVAASKPKPLEPDLDEPTDLTAMPVIPEDTGRRTALGVAALAREPAPVAKPVMPLLEIDPEDAPVEIEDVDTSVTEKPVAPRPAAEFKPPTVEEPTPSGDWTITPNADAPTIQPRKPAPAGELSPVEQVPDAPINEPPPSRITGNWTIQLDSSSPDGWSEPSKVDAVRLPDEPPKPKKPARTKPTPETPPELRPVARSIIMDSPPSAPPEPVFASEEPKVQIDPTLMEAPIVDPNHGAPTAAMLAELMHAPVGASAPALPIAEPQAMPIVAVPVAPPLAPLPIAQAPLPPVPIEHLRLATPVPGTMTPPRPGSGPIDRPTPSPIAIDPRVTPVPGSLMAPGFPPPAQPISPAELVALPTPPPGRLVTDGGVGFFRESGEIMRPSGSGSFEVGDSTSLVQAKRRRRFLVIGLSAAVVVALGIVLVIKFAGGKTTDEAAATLPDAARGDRETQVAIVPTPDATEAVAPPLTKDAEVVAPPPPRCTVAVTTVPAGADVLIQGTQEVLGTTPATLELPCGVEVRLLVRKLRFGSVIRAATPSEDGAKLRISLQKLLFSVKLSSSPAGATIAVNGKAVAVTPTVMRLPAFELSTVTFTKTGYAQETFKVTPKQNNQTVHAQLKRRRR